jgi:TonB-linked SusC/RagA family outer membrane protein
MKKVVILLSCFFLLGLFSVYAQTRTITGKVVSSDDNSPIPGVSVSVRGTTLGTVTNMDGNYSLQVPPDARSLMFSFVGYRTMEVVIETRTNIDVILPVDVFAVDEVIVVGYGVQQKREISGSIASVRGDALKTIPVQTFDQALQGKAAGVQITLPNALLGNPPVIRVRGYNSISGSSAPLVIIDGIPVFTGDLSRTAATLNVLGDLNPSDIESIDVLKDASATAIYGSRAANGVMLITTKKGKQGAAKVNYDTSFGFTQPYRLHEVMNAEQFVAHKNLARTNVGNIDVTNPANLYKISLDAEGKPIDTNWADLIYQTGFQHNHALSFSGASQTTSYFLSVGYSDNEGILKTNTFTRKNARLNLDHKLNKWITLAFTLGYTNSFTNAPQSGSIEGSLFATAGAGRLAMVTSPIIGPRLNDGRYNNDVTSGFLGTLGNPASVGFFNPVFLLENNYNNAQSDRVLSNISATIEPVKGLFLRTVFGYDNSAIESKTFWHPDHGDGRTAGGEAYNYFDRRNRWNWTNTINYSFSIIDKFNFQALIGSEEQYTVFDGWSGRRTGMSDPFFTSYQGSFTTPQQPPALMQAENYFNSVFSRLNFNYDRKYFFEVSGRRDGFSGLAKGNKYGNFGGASLMWAISQESFVKDSEISNFLSDLRIKGSYGRVGNISAVGDYSSLFLYSAGVYNTNPTLFFSQAGNADLAWETSNKLDAGISFGLLEDRIQFEASYYYNEIDGLVLNVPQAPSKGIPNNVIPANIGSMFNKGVELTLTSYNISKKDFQWNTSLNVTTLKNEVTALAPGVEFLIGTSQLEVTNRTLVGHPIGMIWGVQTEGVDPQTGRRVFLRRNINPATKEVTYSKVYYNHQPGTPTSGWRNEDGTASRGINITDDGVALGSPIPKVYGGIDNNLTYKNWDLGIGLTYGLGFYIYNGSKAGLRDQRNWNNSVEVYEKAWKNPGDITDIPRPVWGDNISNGSSMVQSQNVEKGDYLKVRNLSLGYTFQNQLLGSAGIKSVRLYSQVFNAFVFTNYTGADPEISSNGGANLTPGVDRNTIPQARTVSAGLNISF